MSLTVGILGTVSTATVQQIRPPVDLVDYPANDSGSAAGALCQSAGTGRLDGGFVRHD